MRKLIVVGFRLNFTFAVLCVLCLLYGLVLVCICLVSSFLLNSLVLRGLTSIHLPLFYLNLFLNRQINKLQKGCFPLFFKFRAFPSSLCACSVFMPCNRLLIWIFRLLIDLLRRIFRRWIYSLSNHSISRIGRSLLDQCLNVL